MHRGRELGPSGHEAAGAPDAVPPLAPTMSLTARGRHGTPQLDAHPSGGNSPQLSPFALAREPVVPATRSILRLLRPSAPTPVPGDPRTFFPVPVGSGRAPGPFPGARGPCPQPALFVVEDRRCPDTYMQLAGAERISRRRSPWTHPGTDYPFWCPRAVKNAVRTRIRHSGVRVRKKPGNRPEPTTGRRWF